MNQRLIGVVMLSWLSLVAASLLWNWRQANASVMELARMEANSHFEKDLVFRRWVALQGGVYVRPTARTPPNPYLEHLAERDVTTTAGKALTLVNPAYMTRQVHELAAEGHGVLGHITSLEPLRPENAPDDWERRALLTFGTGAREQRATPFSSPTPRPASFGRTVPSSSFRVTRARNSSARRRSFSVRANTMPISSGASGRPSRPERPGTGKS